MKYTSTITSKGTITIAAPLRKALGFSPGQKVSLTLDKNRQVVISGGTTVAEFEKLDVYKRQRQRKRTCYSIASKPVSARSLV